MSKNTISFEKSWVDTKKLPTNSSRVKSHYCGDDISTGSDAGDVCFTAIPECLNLSTAELEQRLFSEENNENDELVKDWWQSNVLFGRVTEDVSYEDISLDERRRLVTSAISAVYFLSMLADKSQTRGLPSNIVKFVSSIAAKSVLRVYQTSSSALSTIKDSLIIREIQTLKNLLVLCLANCFVMIAIVGECDAKENRKINANTYGEVLTKEFRDPLTPDDIKLQILNAFESIMKTSILTRMPWRSGTKSVLQDLTQACFDASVMDSTSASLLHRTQALLVLLGWRNIKVPAQTNSDVEENVSSFDWLTNQALNHIDQEAKNIYKIVVEGNHHPTESRTYTNKVGRLLSLLILFLERGKRDSDTSIHSSEYVGELSIPMDRFFQALNNLAKCIVSMISIQTSNDTTSPNGLRSMCQLSLQLMRALISRVESSRMAMAGKDISEFLERLLLMPRDSLVITRLILYSEDHLGNLLKTISIRSPSVLLRESVASDTNNSTSGMYIAQSVRTKVCLADKIIEQILKLLEMFRTAVINIRSQAGTQFFETLTNQDGFDTRLVTDKNRCIQSLHMISGSLRILAPLLRVSNLPETLKNDLTSLVSWWLLTGLDSLFQSVHLRLTLRGLNSVTANLLSLRQKNGQILSTIESMSLILYVMFQNNASVYRLLLSIIQSILGLDPIVPNVLQGSRLEVSPMLESICTLVKLWNDALSNDAFKLCVDEDGLLLSQALMNQILLRLSTDGSLPEHRFRGIEIDLCAPFNGDEEFRLEKSAVDSPLLRDDQGLYLYQYSSEQQADEHMSGGFVDHDGENGMDESGISRGQGKDNNDARQNYWNSPKERIPFMTGEDSSPNDDDDEHRSESSRLNDDGEEDDHDDMRSSSSMGAEDMGLCSGDENGGFAECGLGSSSMSDYSDGDSGNDDALNDGHDYFMPRAPIESGVITTIIDDDDPPAQAHSQSSHVTENNIGNINISNEGLVCTGTVVSEEVTPLNSEGVAAMQFCDTSPDMSVEQNKTENCIAVNAEECEGVPASSFGHSNHSE